MSVHKYQTTHVQTAAPLSVEVMVFGRTTAALEQCSREAANGRAADATQRVERHVRLCEAIYQNSRLWITILDDLVSPENRLPTDVKQRLASLGATSLTHGRKVLAGQASIQLLIDINRAILTGLSQARDGAHPAIPSTKEAAHASRQA
jgi:flagellar biosynthesis activator protein FlaF